MEDHKRRFYEQEALWDRDYSLQPAERLRLKDTLAAIPSDAHTILDIGCGSGLFLKSVAQELPGRFERLVGLDQSYQATKHVDVQRTVGSIASLPFPNRTFDLLTCLEVLEHLPQADFEWGISELMRVSRRYIIITVPNSEDIELHSVMCPLCYCWFNPYFHMRSFDSDSLTDRFLPEYELEILREIGPEKEYRAYNRRLHSLGRAWFKPLPPQNCVCPQCGYRTSTQPTPRNPGSHTGNARIKQVLQTVAGAMYPKRKRKPWILARYRALPRY